MTQHVLFVCKSCAFSSTQRDYKEQRGGYHLLQSLLNLQQQWALQSKYNVKAVDCLSACNRPCVVALAAPSKTTLMFGDLPPLQSASAVLQLAEQYYASEDGIVPRQERPDLLKKGILARIPPLPCR
jgi:predicted metal-binding protein